MTAIQGSSSHRRHSDQSCRQVLKCTIVVCFLSNELIENETEFEEDTLDLVREDEMKIKLLTIYFNQL